MDVPPVCLHDLPAWLQDLDVTTEIDKATHFKEFYTQRSSLQDHRFQQHILDYLGCYDAFASFGLSSGDAAKYGGVVRCDISCILSFFSEPITLTSFFNLPHFTEFANQYNLNLAKIVNDFGISTNPSSELDGFTAIPPSRKRKNSTPAIDNELRLTNKYDPLSAKDDVNDDVNDNLIEMSEDNPSIVGSQSVGNQKSKPKTHPFLIQLDDHWKKTAESIKNLVKNDITIKLDGQLLKVHTQFTDDFRAIQNYLDSNLIGYTTLSNKGLRPRKVVIRGVPTFTDPQQITEALGDLGFSVSRATMMKSRVTKNPLPMYLVNVLPKETPEEFDKIFEITDLFNLKIKIEKYNGDSAIKQCHRCQKFGHSSEICKLNPKCVKCAGDHLTPNCPQIGKINAKCANCGGPHPASYRGCPHTPKSHNSNKKIPHTFRKHPNNNQTFDPQGILDRYNYLRKNKNPPPPESNPNHSDSANVNTQHNTNTLPSTNNSDFPKIDLTLPRKNVVQQPDNNIDIRNNFNDIFKTFNEINEIFKIDKIIKCILNINKQTKNCKNPFDKMQIIIKQFDTIAKELNLNSYE